MSDVKSNMSLLLHEDCAMSDLHYVFYYCNLEKILQYLWAIDCLLVKNAYLYVKLLITLPKKSIKLIAIWIFFIIQNIIRGNFLKTGRPLVPNIGYICDIWSAIELLSHANSKGDKINNVQVSVDFSCEYTAKEIILLLGLMRNRYTG